MPKRKNLTQQEAQKLFAKFAAPVFRAAKTPSQQKGAQRLAQALWLALVTGPGIEAATFEELEKSFWHENRRFSSLPRPRRAVRVWPVQESDPRQGNGRSSARS